MSTVLDKVTITCREWRRVQADPAASEHQKDQAWKAFISAVMHKQEQHNDVYARRNSPGRR